LLPAAVDNVGRLGLLADDPDLDVERQAAHRAAPIPSLADLRRPIRRRPGSYF
jgi:hypothetical protein